MMSHWGLEGINSALASTHLPAATLLAAGMGRRLGGIPKSALLIDGQSLFQRLVQALRLAGIKDISAVIGPYAETLVPLARSSRVRVLDQQMPDASLVASQRLALFEHLKNQTGRDLILLVADLPLLAVEHIVPVLEAWRARPALIHAQIPVFNGVRGHPVCLSWQAVQAASKPGLGGVREWLSGAREATQVLDVGHDAYITDLDTAYDLESIRRRLYPLPVAWPYALSQKVAPVPENSLKSGL